MKRLITTVLACGTLAVGAWQANAAAQLMLSDGTPAGTVIIIDNGPGDLDSTPGQIVYIGPVGNNWDVNLAVGSSTPKVGSPSAPVMDLNINNSSDSAGSLTIDWSDVGFTSGGSAAFAIGGTSDGTVSFQAWSDPGNTNFGKANLIGTTGVLTPAAGGRSFTGIGAGNVPLITPYSLTMETVIQHPASGTTGFDAELDITPPPPCNCTLTFNGPAALTNCLGDAIPAITASEDCGTGTLTPLLAKLVSATTNGSCPKIIVLTYSATTDCGTTQTFTQTVTSNCRGNICGHVFADCDGSGDLSAGDVGISNVVVSLYDAANHLLGKTTSDVNGGYCFNNLAGGNYMVCITAPSNYCQTAASTSYHWKDNYGRVCWQENDGYTHCVSSGTECWWDKSNCCHWKDSYNRDCWKDNYGTTHCQALCYKSCNAPVNNNCISVTLTNCTSQNDVDFAYTGTKPSLSVSCSGPSYVKCGSTYSYTCTVVNNGNACFKGGTVCTTVGNCNYWGGWSNCNNYNSTCPPLSPGQKCTITVKCGFNSWNCGTVTCQSQASCTHPYGTCTGQSSCNSQCGW